jgi:hypothetical protein
MKQPIFLEYTFLFDATSTWQHLSQFEDDLANFFIDRGFQAEVVKSINGQTGRRILLLAKVDAVERAREAPIEVKDERRKQAGSQLKDMADRKLRAPAVRFMKGK